MVTEYIKREQKMGYDSEGNLVYKVPVSEAAPVEVPLEVAQEVVSPVEVPLNSV
jgi:hypothetical protein